MKDGAAFYFEKVKGNIYKFEELYFFLIFLACLSIHFYFSLVGWTHNIIDQYGFRQAQTAITTFYTIKEGFKLNYITPVLGAPWSIPMEFPLYQWIVAAIVVVFKTSLDQTGRFVSLLFFYLSLIPLYSILGLWLKKRNHKLIILSVILLNPTYLFWSRSFMIESLALFLGLSFGWFIKKFLENQDKQTYLILGVITGCFAALVKVTTFVALGPALAFIFVYIWYQEYEKRYSRQTLKRYLSYGLLLFSIPLLATISWNLYADKIKFLNPMAAGYITSKALTSWNFGTFAQKTDLSVWVQILKNSFVPVRIFGTVDILTYTLPIFFFVYLLFLIFNAGYRKEMALSFLFFISGPIIFTNLYYIHNYYFYANNFFISILLGYFVISLLKINKKTKLVSSFIFLPFILLSLFSIYKKEFYPYQTGSNETFAGPAKAIKKLTKTDDVIFIFGQTWDSSLPYYAQRKAIMDWPSAPLSDKKIQASINSTGRMAALVFFNTADQNFVDEQINYLKFNEKPAYEDKQTRIYLPK